MLNKKLKLKDIATAESSIIMAQVEQFLSQFKAYNLVHSANAQESQAAAAHESAEAQKTIANAQGGKLEADTIAQNIENEFNKKHPGVFGTAKVLHAMGPLISLVGTGYIAKSLKKPHAQSNNVKGVINKPPQGLIYAPNL